MLNYQELGMHRQEYFPQDQVILQPPLSATRGDAIVLLPNGTKDSLFEISFINF